MADNPDRRLKLTLKTQTLYDANLTQSYKLIIDASDGNLMPNEIFLLLHVDPVPGYPSGSELFKGICNPAQLSVLPIDEPQADSQINYYRSAHVELTFVNESDASEAWGDILEAVTTLKTALDYADGLSTTTFWIGTPQ